MLQYARIVKSANLLWRRFLDSNLWRQFDHSLLILTAGFLVVLISAGAFWLSSIRPFSLYERAVVAAAFKRPDYNRPLAKIETPTVQVVTFHDKRPLNLDGRTHDIWVALREEALAACAGASNPVRKLQEVFGLAPAAAKARVVTEIEVASDGLIRPCAGELNTSDNSCGLEFADPPADASKLEAYYERLRLVAKQMWRSYRAGFHAKTVEPSDYPYEGFPFTGMGWTYNWSAESEHHVGISEFVIRRNAQIKILDEGSPAKFCSQSSK